MATSWDELPVSVDAGLSDDVAPGRAARREPSYLAVVDVSATLPEPTRAAGDVHVEVVGDLDPVTGDGAQRALLQCLARASRTLVLDLSRATLDGYSADVLEQVHRAAAERGVDVMLVAGEVPSNRRFEQPGA